MLDLFVLGEHQPNTGFVDAVSSFNGRTNSVYSVKNMSEINRIEKESDWYGVLYDDELISKELLEALPVFFEGTHADVLIAYRADKENFKAASMGPRFFRKSVVLRKDCLNAERKGLVYDKILNGWILSNG